MNENVPATAEFIGRFHPVLVHLPIGFILLLAILEALSLSSRRARAPLRRGGGRLDASPNQATA